MNNITYAVSVDVNNPIIPYNVYVANVLDSNVRYLEITLYQNGNVIALSNEATATASLVTDDVLIDDSVECTISNNIITVPLEDLQRHGNLDVQVTVTEGTKVLAIPFPIQVRVTPNIAEEAQIDENSMGSYAEVVQEIAEARGDYETLNLRIAASSAEVDALENNKEDKIYKVQSIGSQSQTGDNVNYPSVTAVRNYVNTKTDDLHDYIDNDLDELDEAKVSKPSTSPNGTNGQLLRTKGDGTTEWVDVIDSTLSAQGAAAEAKTTGNKIAGLNSAVDEVKNAAGVPTEQLYQRPYIDLDDYSDGTALKTNGSTMTHSNAVCSKYILIGGSSITVNIYAIKDSSAAVCFYDSAKNFISALAPSEGTSGAWRLVNGTYSIPQNTWYIRYSFMKNNSSSAVAANQYISFTELQSSGEWCNKNNEDIGDIKGDLILSVNKRIRFSEIPNPQDAYINNSGVVTSYSAATTSDLIPINGNTQITVDLWTFKGLARAVAFYDGNGSYISGIKASEGTDGTWQHLTGTFTVPETAVKFRFTVKKTNAGINGNVTKQFVLYNENTQIKNIVSEEYPDYNPWRYKKWCAFGTSLTDTSFMNTETGEVTGKYVPFLAETSQMFVTNRGIAGGTLGSGGVSGGSSTILNAILNSSDLSSYDLITVEGFVNDFACGVAIGSIGDTANTTMYGAMYQAIKYIQENSNATLIFITDSTGQYYEFTQSSETGDYRVTRQNGLNLLQQDYNNAVIKCCQYYGVPVIDAGGRSQIDQYRPQYIIDQIHHTTLGGKQYAKTIWAELKNIYPAFSS